MNKKFILFLFLFKIFIIYSQKEEEKEKEKEKKEKKQKPKSWTVEKLYKYLKDTYLHHNNPNYGKNIKYMIFDPEYYVDIEKIQESINSLEALYDKYNISTHIFLISYVREKHKKEETYTKFTEKLSSLIKKEHEMYEEKTITVIFFMKEKKARLISSTSKKLISDEDALTMIDRRKIDFKEKRYLEGIEAFTKDLLKTYQRRLETKNGILILIYTFIFIIVLTIIMLLLSKEQPSEKEEKVKEFMEKLRNSENRKKIFDDICIFCLDNFKSDADIEELKKDEKKKKEFEKEEISKLACGHKFHKKCIDLWKKKNGKCPSCRMKLDIGGDDNDEENKLNKGSVNTIFALILSEVLRIQYDLNMLNPMEINRIKRVYYPMYKPSSNSKKKSASSENKSSPLNDDERQRLINK